MAFDPIELDDQISNFFGLDSNDQTQLGGTLEQLGYESAYLVVNMGSLLVFVAIRILLLFVETSMYCFKCCPRRLRGCSQSRLGKFFFNGLLAFIDGSFLILFTMSLINIIKAKNGDVGYDISFFFAIFVLFLQFGQLVTLTVFFCKNKAHLEEKRHLDRIGFVYQELNFKVRGAWALAFPILKQIRLIVLVLLLAFIRESKVI